MTNAPIWGLQREPRQNRYRTVPPFPIDFWNILNRTANDQPRNNSSIEA